MPIGCRGREPEGARVSVLSPSSAWRESPSHGNWDTDGLGSARRGQSLRCAFMFTFHCVAVTHTPRVELCVLGLCPCFAGGKLSPEMKKPLPHGGGSLQGRISRCVLKPTQVGPLPQRQGNEGEQYPRGGPRGQGRAMIRALCTRERGRLRGVATCSRQSPPVSLLAARAGLFRAWRFPLGARSNLELRFPSFIPLFLFSILCPGSGHTHVHL